MATELCKIWSEYIAIPDWTPADRWLSNRIGATKFSRLERLWISGMFLAALRYGQFALVAETMITNLRATGSVKDRLIKIPAENLFFWIEQRLLAEHLIVLPHRFKHADKEARVVLNKLLESVFKKNDKTILAQYDGLAAWVVPFIDRRATRAEWADAEKNRFIRRHSSTQPLWIRLTKESFRTDVEQELKSAGFTIVVKDVSSYAIRGDKNVATLTSYKKGFIDVQDFASQQIGKAVIKRASDAVHIWDCCAGNGGKTVQIASATEGATVRVSDINDRKLVRIHERAVQQHLTKKIAYVPWDGTKLPDFHKSITENGGFDIVLVDAPCSGSGTWRKNPDGRLFFTEQKLAEILTTQKKLLRLASSAVKPGGWLIYGTCSFFVEENEMQVDNFLSDSRNFRLDEMKLSGNPEFDSDTTFFAALKKMR